MITSEDLDLHDQCARRRTWTSRFLLPRISLVAAMHESLRAGLLSGDPANAKKTMTGLAAIPGLDISAYNVYDIAIHHATLMETVCAYLCPDAPWKAADPVSLAGYQFQPLSYQMDDGRLRRVILCDRWDALRQQAEIHSWRTVADVCATGRPMVLNAIVIGASRKGFRPSPWTQGFVHPENYTMRVLKREGSFSEKWQKLYRENTDKKPLDWLGIMQSDGAFDSLVHSITVDVPARSEEILDEMLVMVKEINDRGTRMRRSSCFRFSPCGFARLCHNKEYVTPETCGWERR